MTNFSVFFLRNLIRHTDHTDQWFVETTTTPGDGLLQTTMMINVTLSEISVLSQDTLAAS